MDDGPQTAKYSFRGTTEERTGLDKVLGGGLNRETKEEQCPSHGPVPKEEEKNKKQELKKEKE